MARNIWITGASGFVGRNLLEAMLKNGDDVFYPLCRSQKSINTILERQSNAEDPLLENLESRLRFVSANIEYPLCNVHFPLQTVDGKPIEGRPDVLIHCAADTDFSEDKSEAERIAMYKKNVEGTQNIINLARVLQPKKVLYFSTAYASGMNEGVIPDEGVVVRDGFKNYYEETKYAARQLMLNSGLPFAIINPTIVIGKYSDGDAEKEKRMIYGYLHAMHVSATFKLRRSGKKEGRRIKFPDYFNSVIPGQEFDCDLRLAGSNDIIKNVVPVDQLVEASIAVINSSNSIGRTYNVGGTELTVGTMLESMQRALKVRGFRFEPSWDGKTEDNIQDGLTKELAPYRPYVTISDPKWDDSNLRALGVSLPKITPEKFDQMMDHYVKNYLIK